jgi:hypothetical protein
MTKQLLLLDTQPDWRLDERTRRLGAQGIAAARAVLAASLRSRATGGASDPPVDIPTAERTTAELPVVEAPATELPAAPAATAPAASAKPSAIEGRRPRRSAA